MVASPASPGLPPKITHGSTLRVARMLCRKNYNLKKRSPCLTCCEVVCPVIFVALMSLLFIAFTEDNVSTRQYAIQMPDGKGVGVLQSVRPVGLAPQRFHDEGLRLAVVGEAAHVTPFLAWLDTVHPALNGSSIGGQGFVTPAMRSLHVPKLSDVVVTFPTNNALQSYIEEKDYGFVSRQDEIPLIYAAISFNSVAPTWDISIRVNQTSTPSTKQYVDVLARDQNLAFMFDYLNAKTLYARGRDGDTPIDGITAAERATLPGFLTWQRLVDRYIISQSVATSSLPSAGLIQAITSDAFTTLRLDPAQVFAEVEAIQNLTFTDPARVAALTAALQLFYAEETYQPQNVQFAPFPETAFKSNGFYGVVADVFPNFFVLTLMFTVGTLVRALVAEKETKIREGMRLMGLSDASLFLSWWSTYAVIFALIGLLGAAFAKINFFGRSDFVAIFLLFFLFGTSIISLAMLISVFFTKAKLAMTLGLLMYYALYFPLLTVQAGDVAPSRKIAASLASPTAFSLGIQTIAKFEDNGQGMTLGTNAQTALQGHNFAFAWALAMLAADTVLYAILFWYADAVVPQTHGVARPWHFPFHAAYWRGVFGLAVADEEYVPLAPKASTSVSPKEQARRAKYLEPLDSELKAKVRDGKCIKVRGLAKTFSTPDGPKVAVDGIDLTIVEGSVFVLLGHNGAGKTTTISMLAGMLAPTAGTATMYGYDIHTSMKTIRSEVGMGVCPQHDVLWPELTVTEHLRLFAGIKGVPAEDVEAEITKSIVEVGLTEKTHARAHELSGGQKRKLSIAIALIGGSKVIILDEPTSGMDPYSRRSTWQIIQNARAGRIVMMTTHFMDEADILGDRLAIMSHGRVQCAGTPLFLKHQYGVGYLLTAVKGEGCDASAVESLMQRHVADAEVNSNVGAELSFRLPMSASPAFPKLFAELDAGLGNLKLLTYGLSATTIEEVFLRVAHGEQQPTATKGHALTAELSRQGSHLLIHDDDDGGDEAKAVPAGAVAVDVVSSGAAAGRSSDDHADFIKQASTPLVRSEPAAPASSSKGMNLDDVRAQALRIETNIFQRHFKALLWKRFHFFKRDGQAWCCQLVLPLVMVALGLVLIKIGALGAEPAYQLSTFQFNAKDLNEPADGQLTNFVPYLSYAANGFTSASGSALLPGDSSATVLDIVSRIPSPNATTVSVSPQSGLGDPYGFLSATQQLAAGGKFDTARAQNGPALVNMSTWLLEAKSDNKASKYGAYVFGDTLGLGTTGNAVQYTIMANLTAFHGTAIYMNQINDALYKRSVGAAANDPTRRIVARNEPLPLTDRQKQVAQTISSFQAATMVVIAFAFIPASYAFFIVKEREVGAKHQQLISGVSVPAYWASTLVWDYTSYMMPLFGTVILVAAFDIEDFVETDDGRLGALFLSLFMYGLSAAAFAYLVSHGFKSHSSAMIAVIFIGIFSVILMTGSFIMNLVESTCLVDRYMRYVYRLLPGYSLGNSLVTLSVLSVKNRLDAVCDGFHSDTPVEAGAPYSALDWNAAGADVFMMAITTVVYFGLALLIDIAKANPSTRIRWHRILHKMTCSLGITKPPASDGYDTADVDGDVKAETERTERMQATGYNPADDVVVMNHLRKVYDTGKVAVKDVSLGIGIGEVFGYLGINGAGKTSTLKVLSGDVVPTSGTASVAGYDIIREQPKLRRLLGYCPQFDALLDLVTVREHLELFARIKGISEERLDAVVATKLKQLDLEEYSNKTAGSLSGGNKRKLSVAIALIGKPPVVILDEPSTGMDPMARRFMWDVITRVATQQKGCSVILVSHSMEECEALCTRLAIMVGGRLRCVGSVQHLKNKFGQGYTAEINVGAATVEGVKKIADRIRAVPGVLADEDPAPYLASGGRGSTVVAATPGSTSSNGGGGAAATPSSPVQVRRMASGPSTGNRSDMGKIPGVVPLRVVRSVCAALRNPQRGGEISEGGSGWAMHQAFLRTARRAVSVAEFALWWAEEDIVGAITQYMTAQAFPGSHRIERHGTKLRFQIPPQSEPLGRLFGRLESQRARLSIQEYSLSQVSLEQVFNGFAAQQEEEKGVARGVEHAAGAGTDAGATAVPAAPLATLVVANEARAVPHATSVVPAAAGK